MVTTYETFGVGGLENRVMIIILCIFMQIKCAKNPFDENKQLTK